MPKQPLNILLFAVDSLRADHMSTYGYHRLTTPHIDRLSASGVTFDGCYSAYIPTTPAYSSILTGKDVMSTEMVALSPKGPIDSKIPLLPELLRPYGYASIRVGFGGDFYRGFDRWLSYGEGWLAWEDRPARKAENLNEVAIPALEELVRSGQPWLLFMRHMDPHAPYLPPAPFDRIFYSGDPCAAETDTMGGVRNFAPFANFHLSWMPPGITDINYVVAQYDGALAYMDACIQRILTRLEELGQRDNTLIVFTADHGETLTEHDCYFDHHGLYDPTLHVPLIYSCPGYLPVGQRVGGNVLHEDLVPTILEILGLGGKGLQRKFDGHSAMSLIRGEASPLHSEFYITECTWMRKRGWRTPQWKYIEAMEPDFHHKPPVELYNLTADPLELHNLADAEPEVVQHLAARMRSWVSKRLKQTHKPDPIMQYQMGLDRRIGSIAVAQKLQER